MATIGSFVLSLIFLRSIIFAFLAFGFNFDLKNDPTPI